MKYLKYLLFGMCAVLMTSCYEKYEDDYAYSAAYFASQKPLRTVISDRDMEIRVGVAIGGKREVDMNDWARFEIDPALLDGTGLELLPAAYYELADPELFRVSKSTLAVADVAIRFTDAFYADPLSVTTHYALPFRVVESSLDKLLDGKQTSIVAIKYISTYGGTYYVTGSRVEINDAGEEIGTPEIYRNADLSKNITRETATVATNVVVREGVSNFTTDVASEKVRLTFGENGSLTVGTADGGIEISDASGSYDASDERLVLNMTYSFSKGGKKYRVTEQLTRRQDPLKDLRYEEW